MTKLQRRNKEITRLYRSGMSRSRLSEMYGLSYNYIWKITRTGTALTLRPKSPAIEMLLSQICQQLKDLNKNLWV